MLARIERRATAAGWELTINDPVRLTHGTYNTWQRCIMNKRQSEIQYLIILILKQSEGSAGRSLPSHSPSLLLPPDYCTVQLFHEVSPFLTCCLLFRLYAVKSSVKLTGKANERLPQLGLQSNMFLMDYSQTDTSILLGMCCSSVQTNTRHVWWWWSVFMPPVYTSCLHNDDPADEGQDCSLSH